MRSALAFLLFCGIIIANEPPKLNSMAIRYKPGCDPREREDEDDSDELRILEGTIRSFLRKLKSIDSHHYGIAALLCGIALIGICVYIDSCSTPMPAPTAKYNVSKDTIYNSETHSYKKQYKTNIP